VFEDEDSSVSEVDSVLPEVWFLPQEHNKSGTKQRIIQANKMNG
jgi:hypothetical protein